MNELHPRTVKVLKLIACHSETGITSSEMAAMLGEPTSRVHNSIMTLRDQNKIKVGKRTNRFVSWIPYDATVLVMPPDPKKPESNAHIHRPKTGLTQPQNGPGHSKKPDPVMGKPAFIPHKNGTTTSDWTFPTWETARPHAEDHKQHGSMRAGPVEAWSPPVSMCVGRGVLQFAPARMQQ